MEAEGFNVGHAVVLRESDKSILVRLEEDGEETWVPKSQIHDDSEVWKADQSGDLIVSNWIAAQKGWA